MKTKMVGCIIIFLMCATLAYACDVRARAYVAPYKQVYHVAPYVSPTVVSSDYFLKLKTDYKADVIADAAAFRALKLLKGDSSDVKDTIKAETKNTRSEVSAYGLKNKDLQALVNDKCVKCHGNTASADGKGLDFRDISLLPKATLDAMAVAVYSQKMPPPGDKTVSNEETALFMIRK